MRGWRKIRYKTPSRDSKGNLSPKKRVNKGGRGGSRSANYARPRERKFLCLKLYTHGTHYTERNSLNSTTKHKREKNCTVYTENLNTLAVCVVFFFSSFKCCSQTEPPQTAWPWQASAQAPTLGFTPNGICRGGYERYRMALEGTTSMMIHRTKKKDGAQIKSIYFI